MVTSFSESIDRRIQTAISIDIKKNKRMRTKTKRAHDETFRTLSQTTCKKLWTRQEQPQQEQVSVHNASQALNIEVQDSSDSEHNSVNTDYNTCSIPLQTNPIIQQKIQMFTIQIYN